MKVLIDTREHPQAITRIIAWLDRNGIEWEKKKLDIGDYMIEGRPDRVVDRKQSCGELASNLLSPDRRRFYNEVRKAHDDGVNLIILCEHGGDIKTFNDIPKWKNKYGFVTGKKLQDAVFALEMAYHVPVVFCDKRSTGRRIVEILTEENNGHEQPE